jgi:hypothetical protein
MRRRLGPLALLALLGSACGEPRLLDGFAEGQQQTRIRVRPSEFVGSVGCERGVNGGLQSYIARLQEVDPNAAPDAGFTTLYTTGAVPCDEAVIFPALAGRLYGGEIYGFDTAAATEADIGSARWSAVCGRGQPGDAPGDAGLDPYRPTLSELGATVPLRGCTSFSGGAGEALPRLVIDTASALGALQCGNGPGQVFALRGTLEGETQTALCQEPLVFTAPAANRYYTIQLTGLAADGASGGDAGSGDAASGDAGSGGTGITDAGTTAPPPVPAPLDAGVDASAGDALDASVVPPADAGAAPPPDGIPRWQTSCVGRAVAGATAPAVCDPLRPLGATTP